ncbi:MAG: PilZ protein [Rhizobium sp.]|jgi:hypothetical protein|nr:PilZ protein [Rhizobium sp.]
MTPETAHRNFLSQLIEDNAKEKPKRKVKLACSAFYLKKGIRGYTSQKVVMTELSVSACRVTCPVAEAIEGHLYLVIEGWPAKFACVVKKRYEDDLEIRFCNDLPAQLVEKLTVSRF